MTSKAIKIVAASLSGAAICMTGATVAASPASASTSTSVQANTGADYASVSVYRYVGNKWVDVYNTETNRAGRFYVQEPTGYYYDFVTTQWLGTVLEETYGNPTYAQPGSTITTVPFAGVEYYN